MRGEALAQAVRLLRRGELVAMPTETVYGLGADASNPVALAKIFAAKGRPADHPLIVHVADATQLPAWARDIPESAYKLAATFWPGPLTLILKRQPGVSDLVTGGQDTVGLRVPNHPLALQLLNQFAGGIAAPSANRFGRISPTSAQHVREELGDRVALVLDGGPCAVGIESTILDLSRGRPVILRPGMISAVQIEQALNAGVTSGSSPNSPAPRVSGSLAAHYAPVTAMRLVPASVLLAEVEHTLEVGQRVAVLSAQACATQDRVTWLQASAQPEDYAHDLYAHLRKLDQCGADLILVESPPHSAPWLPIRDRLERAAFGAGESDSDGGLIYSAR